MAQQDPDGGRTRRHVLCGLGVGLAAGLAGCGGGGNGGGTPTPGGGGNGGTDGSGDGSGTATPTATRTPEPTEPPTATEPPPTPEIDRNALERAIAERANEIRAANGVGFLDWDPALQSIARDHSADMIRKEYFDHVDPMGRTYSDRYGAADYRCAVQVSGGLRNGGECIARVDYDERPSTAVIAADAVDQLRDDTSAGSMLATYWDVHGVGIAVDPQAPGTRIYVTQNFC